MTPTPSIRGAIAAPSPELSTLVYTTRAAFCPRVIEEAGIRRQPVTSPPASAGHVECGEDPGWPQPDHQFARHRVAAAELLGLFRPHVPARDRGGGAEQFGRVLGQLDLALPLDEAVRRLLQVHAQRGPRVADQRAALGRL